jgi:hypothetical protein
LTAPRDPASFVAVVRSFIPSAVIFVPALLLRRYWRFGMNPNRRR